MTNATSLTLATTLPEREDPSQVAEMYADRLMDELFGGVERALEGDVDALKASMTEPLTVAASEVESDPADAALAFSEGGLPAVLLSPPGTLGYLGLSGDLTAPPGTEAEGAIAPDAPRQGILNRVLLGAAGLSLGALVTLWWVNHQRATVLPATAPTAEVANPDGEFLEYLRRSLDVISQQATNSAAPTSTVPEVNVALGGGSPLGLPPLGNTVPGGSLPANGLSPQVNVIERVYIPYPVGQGTSVAAAPSASYGTPTAVPAPAAPAAIHALVGVLELGDRSAALFEINGVPQRVYIGERIGSSDWFLVTVANEEAVVRRNGEVRSIFIGQRF